jgi:hypothetical protein
MVIEDTESSQMETGRVSVKEEILPKKNPSPKEA